MKEVVWIGGGSIGIFVLLYFVFPAGLMTSIGGAAVFLVLASIVALHRRSLDRRRFGDRR